MTPAPPDIGVSVVLCAYADERWPALRAAVASVLAQTRRPRELIVVVDHNPALLSRARRELDGGGLVVANEEARGLSGARNTGVALARGEVVAFLDDDAVAAPSWLEHLVAPYADPAVVAVGGSVDPRWLGGGRPAGFPPEFDWVVGCTYRGAPTTACEVRNVIGANMSFRRDVVRSLGGFRTGVGRVGRVPEGCEETELCIRARRRLPGAAVRFEPRARVAHAVPHARAGWRYFGARCFAEGRSKARVAAAAGPRDALASERAYTLRTLPPGVLRGLREAAHGDAGGLARSAAIVAGFGLTTAGYAVGAVGAAGGGGVRRAAVGGRQPAAAPPAPSAHPRRAPVAAEPPRFTVIVPTCGRTERLAACLDAVLAGERVPDEVVVVDNAPADPATAALLREPRYARVRRVEEPRAGAPRARAAGLAAAREPFVAFLDDDVIADRAWLARIADAFASDPAVAAVTTRIRPAELAAPAQRWLEQFGGFDKGTRRRVFDLGPNRAPDSLYPYSPGLYGSGASMAFRTRTLRELGGFDLRLDIGGEDLDVLMQIVLGGHRLVYEPAAVAWHRHPADAASLKRTMFLYVAGLTALMTKHGLSDPACARYLLVRLPRAARLVLDPRSRKNAGKRDDYPAELTRAERLGMLAGPFLFAGSSWRARRDDGR